MVSALSLDKHFFFFSDNFGLSINLLNLSFFPSVLTVYS